MSSASSRQLTYQSHGTLNDPDSPTLLFLHGLTGNLHTYDHIIEALDDAYPTICADLRGHGDSPHALTYRAADYASDVVDLILSLDAGPVILIGHSLGGVTALATAALRPDLVSGLFLEDPPVFEGDPDVRAKSPAVQFFEEYARRIRHWQSEGTSLEDVAAAVGSFPSIRGESRLDRTGDQTVRAVATGLLKLDPTTVDAAVNGQIWQDYDPLASIDCPVTLLRADPAAGAVFAEGDEAKFKAAVPNANVLLAEGMGHGIHEDRDGRDLYLHALSEFLQSVS